MAPDDFERFKRRNSKKIEKLKVEFVRLYWEGLDHYTLQNRVADEFAKQGILCKTRGFAEIAIYNDLMESKQKERNESGKQ